MIRIKNRRHFFKLLFSKIENLKTLMIENNALSIFILPVSDTNFLNSLVN
jgi:hypothetical protein